MECSVSGDVSRYLNELYGTYDHFDVRQTTISVDHEEFEAVAERPDGIAVRDARTFSGLDSHVRVAVRRPHENDRLLDSLLDR